MDLWENRAIRKRMEHLAQQCARRPGTAAEKAAATELMGVCITRKDPIKPALFREASYKSRITTPQKPKDESDKNRKKGDAVKQAVREMSLWGDIFCAITFGRLHAYQITHTLAFAAPTSLRHAYEIISGLHLDSMHVETRLNKIILSLGMHALDTGNTLLRFPVFIRPDGQPVLSPRVSSIIEWNTLHKPAEHRNGFAELPPMGPDSPGILYWALQLDTCLDFVTHYNLDGLNPYHSPIKYGSFYYSNEDPFAVIGNTAHNMKELEKRKRLNYQHLCPWAQAVIDAFVESHLFTITGGGLPEDHNKYYAALPLPPISADDKEDDEAPKTPPTYAIDSPLSTAPNPPSPSIYTPSSDGSDSELDDPTPSSPSPQVPLKETRAMTQDDRKHGAKVKKALMEERLRKVDEVNERIEREQEEQELRSQDSESDTVENMQERARAKDRARMERIMEALIRNQDEHDLYNLTHCNELDEQNGKDSFEPARFKILQDSRQHKRSYVAAAKKHFHVTRSKTKAVLSELAPLQGEPSYKEWVDGWKVNRRFPHLPCLEELSVVDMAPPPAPKSKDSSDTGASGPASLSTTTPALSASLSTTVLSPSTPTNSPAIPAPPVVSESNDTIPDTSDMPTPRARTRDLETLSTPSGEDESDAAKGTVNSLLEPSIAGLSRQRKTETVPSSDTASHQDRTPFTFTHSHARSSAGPSQQSTAARENGGEGARNRELRSHNGDAGNAGPSGQATGRSGTRAGRGRNRHAAHTQTRPSRCSARQAARNAEQTDTDTAEPDTGNTANAEPDTGKKRKVPASAPEKGYETKTKKRRGDGGQ